ncbi:hypothetical protein GV828_00125 [Flavobacterium sp. NST-5]|uniref:Uncharacterized protein n=1 Tax=Flavobacterium ichthyis TaxID=2698827 RepID=A0ABW9Z437_9FLAO|nr:hypothetical protein [Flavobacterium ichthyis]NBL63603.1 hypothetical protein [Flavobacterium ichthyis]
MITQQQRTALFFCIPLILLTFPLVAMQFTTEVDWNWFDFLIAGILLFGTAFLCELVLRKFKPTKTRLMICTGILFILFLIWAELALGIFGSPIAGS